MSTDNDKPSTDNHTNKNNLNEQDAQRDISDDKTRIYVAANKNKDTAFSATKNADTIDSKDSASPESPNLDSAIGRSQADASAEQTHLYVASNINQDTHSTHPDRSVTPQRQESQSADPWTQNTVADRQVKGSGGSGGGMSGGGGASSGGGGGGGGGTGPDASWERDILNRLAFATLNEQRRARRWGVFFKFLAFVYVGAVLFYLPADMGQGAISAGGKHTAIIDIEGPIAADTIASADNIVSGLRAAFENKNTAGIILRINSPGGSPVQAGYIYDEIKRLRKKYQGIKLYAVITDVCASGGYYIAAAADEIYADKASIVGSIGVLMNGFGFVEAMKKIGVERRLLTAGEHKGVLDPFSPVNKDEKAHVQTLLNGVHQQFIDVVKNGRGDRLKDDPNLFSGLFWNGEEGLALGLVDGLGSSSYVAREIIGVEKLVDFSPRVSYLDRFADRIGATFARVMINTLGFQSSGMQ